uniref:Uncharacterized protein n=1 Tax=Ciona savignyi TaxID=51511 RepID=H2Z2Z1_CIOSA
MAKLKENPKDEELKKQLKDVQKHIAELGTIQKHLGKSKQKENQKAQVEKGIFNGQLQETNRKVSKVIKSEVIDNSSPVAQSNHYPTQNGQPSHCDATVTPSGSCMAIVNKVLNDKLTTNFKKQHETKELSKVLANNSVVIPHTPTTTVAQNGTTVKVEQQPLNLTKSGSQSNHLFKSYYPNTPVILPITPISEFTSSKRPTSQTVKFRVPVSGRPVGRSIVLLSTSKLNNDKSTFRLVSPKA